MIRITIEIRDNPGTGQIHLRHKTNHLKSNDEERKIEELIGTILRQAITQIARFSPAELKPTQH
jgi:hypothetical protein